jgi:hypothetical protein
MAETLEVAYQAGREHLLQEKVDYLTDAMEAEDGVPKQLVERERSDEPLLKVQNNFFLGIRLHILDVVNPANGLILDKRHIEDLRHCEKEILDMVEESKILEYELSVADEMSPFQAFEKIRELRKRQIHILNGLMIKTIQVLEAEKRLH